MGVTSSEGACHRMGSSNFHPCSWWSPLWRHYNQGQLIGAVISIPMVRLSLSLNSEWGRTCWLLYPSKEMGNGTPMRYQSNRGILQLVFQKTDHTYHAYVQLHHPWLPKVVHSTYAHLFPSHSLLIQLSLLLRFAETIPCHIPQQLPRSFYPGPQAVASQMP